MIMESGVSDIIKNCTDFIMNQTSLKMVKAARLRWLGHLYRTEELNPCEKLAFSKPMGTRKTTSKMVGQCSTRSADTGG
jgi:hypothetical protein